METRIHVSISIKKWTGSLYLELIIVVTSDRMRREMRVEVMALLEKKEANRTECLQLLILDEGIMGAVIFIFSVFNFFPQIK